MKNGRLGTCRFFLIFFLQNHLTLTLRQGLTLPSVNNYKMKGYYTVKQVAEMAGVTIRTLHLYEDIDLLRPAFRAESGYRYYGEKELLRLQQVLFYRELDYPLKTIAELLDDPGFDITASLKAQKKALQQKRNRLATLVKTIDKTVNALKNNSMIHEELYEGLPAGKAAAYRKEAIESYGRDVVERAESHLKTLDKEGVRALIERQKELAEELFALKGADPAGADVQRLVALHYNNTRKLWGTDGAADKQADAYKGLGLLYLTDERFTLVDNEYNREFADFMSRAMAVFAESL